MDMNHTTEKRSIVNNYNLDTDCISYETKYVKDVYNSIAEHFDNTRAYVWSWVSDFILEYCLSGTIYDIGCGNGRNSLLLKDKGINHTSQFICVDNSRSLLDICKNKGLQTIESSITNLHMNIQESSADNILCIAVLHHIISRARQLKSLKELARILKPDGRLLLSVWSIHQPSKIKRTFHFGENIVKWNKFGKVYERFYYIFQKEELERLICESGLIIEHSFWDCGNEVYILKSN